MQPQKNMFNRFIYENDDPTLLTIHHSAVNSGKRMLFEHHHTQFEISYIKTGSGVYTVSDKTYIFKPGDVFVYSSDEQHCITDVFEGDRLELINVHFEPRFIWSDNSGFANCELLKIFFDRNERFENMIDREHPCTSDIIRHIDLIEEELTLKKPQYKHMVKMYVSYILIKLLREYGYVKNEMEYFSDTLSLLEKAIKYIDDNIESDISLEQIAEIATMNRTYFCTVIKKYNGLSPWDYITIKRVERAIEYLKTETSTKTEIAGKCGFSSMSNFYRAFKQVTGKTPNDYAAKGIDGII